MRKEFKLSLSKDIFSNTIYSNKNIAVLCYEELREFFEFPVKKEILIGVLSDKKTKNSYLIEVVYDCWIIKIEGKNIAAYVGLISLINKHFNGKCYGSIEYE